MQGQRILIAVLDPASAAKLDNGPATIDAATNLSWSKVGLIGWVGRGDLTPDLPAVWAYSSDLYNTSCGSCHALHAANAYLANQWIGNLAAMKRFTSLVEIPGSRIRAARRWTSNVVLFAYCSSANSVVDFMLRHASMMFEPLMIWISGVAW